MNLTFEKIILEKKGNLGFITLNDPKSFNALNVSVLNEVYSALEDCVKDDSIRCVILSGNGKMFSSGGNVKEFKEAVGEGTAPKKIADISEILHKCVNKIIEMPKPVLCKMHGGAYGAGLNLGLSCDIVIAADSTVLDQAFVNVGLSVDAGGTYTVPRLIGMHRAKEFFWLGKIDAKKAESWGIINYAVPEADLDGMTDKIAKKLASAPPINIKNVKKMVNETFLNNHVSHLIKERQKQIETAGSEDFGEGVTAFFEKRKPEYKGK